MNYITRTTAAAIVVARVANGCGIPHRRICIDHSIVFSRCAVHLYDTHLIHGYTRDLFRGRCAQSYSQKQQRCGLCYKYCSNLLYFINIITLSNFRNKAHRKKIKDSNFPVAMVSNPKSLFHPRRISATFDFSISF